MYHRKPAVAGAFYSSSKSVLEKSIDTYLKNAENSEIDGDIIGLISPHAGYIYSGPVAAYSYNTLKGAGVEVAVVLAPSHRARFDGASVIPEGIYETPLGDVVIDNVIGSRLLEIPGFSFIREAHEAEHSLEVQVPFLQRVINDFQIVPVIIGTTNLDACRSLADGLISILKEEKRKFVIIISTDLSHYYEYSNAVSIDEVFIQKLVSFEEKEVKDAINSKVAEACGEGPVLTGIMLCKGLGAKGVEVLKYLNSGDTAGDRSQVVGYLSAAVIK